MKITKSQLQRIIREAVQLEVQWEKDPDTGAMYFTSSNGDYMWTPSVGLLEFQSWKTGRVQRLSKAINPRRSGGFHNLRTEEEASARVLKHMKRQK